MSFKFKFTSILEAEPGKLDIKRRKSGILFISVLIDLLQMKGGGGCNDLIIDFHIDSMSSRALKIALMKSTAVTILIRSRCNNAIDMIDN